MRSGFLIILIAALLFSGGYFYTVAESVCPVPIPYSLGMLDERFNLSKEEALAVLQQAESVWERATEREIFEYQEDGALQVNFIFDERQELSNTEDLLKEKLDATENVGNAFKETYATLVNNYNTLRIDYSTKADLYEQKLQAYNTEVAQYNNRGGAPAHVYESLARRKKELADEQTFLNAQSNKLNALVSEINVVGEKANSVINTYNDGVGVYNKTFGEPREFTQGDYTNNTIKIYKFESTEELVLVLVHELGHALALNHVEGKESVMHYLLGGQSPDMSLSTADLQEFDRVCGKKNIWEKLNLVFQLQQ